MQFLYKSTDNKNKIAVVCVGNAIILQWRVRQCVLLLCQA